MESISDSLSPKLGSGMVTRLMMMNEMAKTAIPMKSRGDTSVIDVFSVTVPTSTPASSGVRVAVSEFSVPPIWMSWLPLLPPPPSMLSMGFTTVFSMQTQKPHTSAPSR